MISVDTRALIRQLGPVAAQTLEAAAERCVANGRTEVLPEHFLVTALERNDTDIARLALASDLNAESIRDKAQAAINSDTQPGAGPPVWSSRLLQAFADGVAIGLAELGQFQLRTGSVLVALLRRPELLSSEVSRAFDRLDAASIIDRFAELTAGSAEQQALRQGGDAGVSTPAGGGRLESYTTDLLRQAADGDLDPVLGRESELEQLIAILCRRRKNNPVLVGEPGVGKTAVVEGLALAMHAGLVPPSLRDVGLRTLDLGALRAGASVRGELERRMKGVLDAVLTAQPPLILFVDEAHTLLGAKGGQGGDEAADLLKPALARGKLQMIAATTWREYKRDFEKDPALARRFELVPVEEPDDAQAATILRGVRTLYESKHGVRILDEAIGAAVGLANRYLPGRSQPDKGLDVIDTAASYVRLSRVKPPLRLVRIRAERETVERELASLQREQNEGLEIDTDRIAALEERETQLGDKLHEGESAWKEAADYAMQLDELRANDIQDKAHAERISGLRDQVRIHADMHPDQAVRESVDAAAVADVISKRTGVPLGQMMHDQMVSANTIAERLGSAILDQQHAVAAAANAVRSSLAGLTDAAGPTEVLLCVGPSGVGKTELARQLATVAFGGERFLITVNMGEYQERSTVSRLIGSPPGYVGFGEGGQLTEAVRQRPYSVVLLDEIEKAHVDVLGLFYDVLDRGHLKDGEGRSVSFRNTIIMMTSNLATDTIERACRDSERPSAEELEDLIRPELEACLRPALLARTTVIPFFPLRTEIRGQIAAVRLDKLATRLYNAHGTNLEIGPGVLTWLAERAAASAGVRAIDGMIRRYITAPVTDAVLAAITDGVICPELRVAVTEDRLVVRGIDPTKLANMPSGTAGNEPSNTEPSP